MENSLNQYNVQNPGEINDFHAVDFDAYSSDSDSFYTIDYLTNDYLASDFYTVDGEDWETPVDPIQDVTLHISGRDLLIEGENFSFHPPYTTPETDEGIPVIGSNDNDTLEGGSGADRLFGLNGDDVLSGGDGSDTLDGGAGYDELNENNGNDTLFSGPYGGAPEDKQYTHEKWLDGGDGDDSLYGESGKDVLVGGNGNDSLYGGEENDRLYGDNGDDALYGGAGRDSLDGNEGYDVLYGGSGDDRIYVSEGGDMLLGGDGSDTFLFNSITQEPNVIEDFSEGDVLKFTNPFSLDEVDMDAAPAPEVSFDGAYTYVQAGDYSVLLAGDITLDASDWSYQWAVE